MTDDRREKLEKAYHVMLEQLKTLWHETEEKARPTLKSGLDKTLEKVSELEEVTMEEANAISRYLKKDIELAADFLQKSGKAATDWLKFDLQYAEQKFAELFSETVDMTHFELDELEAELEDSAEWHTGEITGIGTLVCKECDEQLHFKKPGHVPPCPKCANTRFRKKLD